MVVVAMMASFGAYRTQLTAMCLNDLWVCAKVKCTAAYQIFCSAVALSGVLRTQLNATASWCQKFATCRSNKLLGFSQDFSVGSTVMDYI